MGNIQGKFAEQNDIVTTGQILSANNNQASFNAALADANHLQGTNVSLQPSGLLTATNAPIPSVATALQGTVGAALGGIGQGGTASEQPGGGGIPCFIGITNVRRPNNGQTFIRDIQIKDIVTSFNPFSGVHIEGIVTDTFAHLVYEWMLVEFADGHSTGVDKDGHHKYWTQSGLYAPIRDLDATWRWDNGWKPRRIKERRVIKEETILYNVTVKCEGDFHNYMANNDAVSNLKPIGSGEVE